MLDDETADKLDGKVPLSNLKQLYRHDIEPLCTSNVKMAAIGGLRQHSENKYVGKQSILWYS